MSCWDLSRESERGCLAWEPWAVVCWDWRLESRAERFMLLGASVFFDWGKWCSNGLPQKTKQWSMITTSRHLKHYIFLCNSTKSSLPIPHFSIIQSRLHIYYVSESMKLSTSHSRICFTCFSFFYAVGPLGWNYCTTLLLQTKCNAAVFWIVWNTPLPITIKLRLYSLVLVTVHSHF